MEDTPQLVSWPIQPVVDTAVAPQPDAPSTDADADPFVDEERAAIRWVESLTDEEASVVVADATAEWDRITGMDTAQEPQVVLGECDDCHVPLVGSLTFDGDINRRCARCGKPYRCVATKQAGGKSPTVATAVVQNADGWAADTVDPDEVPPCPTCGSLVAWQSLAGTWRCMSCDPPRVARRLRRQRDLILRREERRRMRATTEVEVVK